MAESAVAYLPVEFCINEEGKRMFVKQIIRNNGDILPNTEYNTLTIKLHSLSATRYTKVAEKLAVLLTSTDTVFHNTSLNITSKPSQLRLREIRRF